MSKAQRQSDKPQTLTIPAPHRKRKGIDLSKYAGKVIFDVDPVAYQRQLRDEW